MKFLYLIFVIFCMTHLSTAWFCGGGHHGHGWGGGHHGHGWGGGYGGWGGGHGGWGGGFGMDVKKNTNVAQGSFTNSQINMSNGGHGNVQANSKKVLNVGRHC